jgi:uroporphyrin-III C-methyltransferase
MSTPGKVYLVGAGPGHPDLLTIKAQKLIRAADIIIYDRLVQEDILAEARGDGELIYVGKRPGQHQSRQEEINQLLVAAAHRATVVVRLKGGDPVLFGRGGEEAEYLASHGVTFEVVPGVTAGLSVPMAAGIPVTHRDHSSSVALVTGHRRSDRSTAEVNWRALAGLDTLVFFMSVGKLPEISARLVEHGRPADTPAAIIQKGYWPEEQTVVGTLGELPELAERAAIKPPAIIVIGEVVRVREKLTTFHRDLRRDKDEEVGFGLSADSLLARVGATVRTAKDVVAAVELRLFDALEQPSTPDALAQAQGLELEPLRELLKRLAGLGLLLREAGAYRNAEASSMFLTSTSPQCLGPRLDQELQMAEAYDPLVELRRHPEKHQ